MKRTFTAAIAVAAITLAAATQAQATAFPSLTSIYVAAGVSDNSLDETGVATAISCINTSGQTASARY